MVNTILHGDCLDLLRAMPDDSVDLVVTSPPYVNARTYGIDFALKGQVWVDWSFARFVECCRVSRGLVAWVVEGKTSNFCYDCTPALLIADLCRAGINLRKPPIFKRVGIPGSGGPDWLRNDWEWIICATPPGKLPFSNNTAMGHPPKWAPGGEMSNRKTSGARVNGAAKPWGEGGDFPETKNGDAIRRRKPRLERGNEKGSIGYDLPKLANPGNVIECIVGGGVMGSKLCHENEAPYPEALAEFFIRSFCPEGGIVLDPFCGSGTTLAVAERWGRKWIGMDVRESQVELSGRRVAEVAKVLFE